MKSATGNTKLKLIKGNALRCEDFQYLHPEYQEKDLSESVMTEMEHHQGCCPECQEYDQDITYLVKQARILLKTRPLPADTKQRVYQRLNEKLGLQLS